MTYQESKRYRRFQTFAAIMVGIFFFSSTVIYAFTNSWATWAIMGVITLTIVVLSYRAAKMEVLTVLGVSVDTYEHIINKEKARRAKR